MARVFKVDFAANTVSISTDGGGSYTPVAHVLEILVAQKYRAASNDWQGDIVIRVATPDEDTVVVNQAPAVLTAVTRQAMAGVPSEKKMWSLNGDSIKLYNGVTLAVTINCDGGGGTFGSEGDALLMNRST